MNAHDLAPVVDMLIDDRTNLAETHLLLENEERQLIKQLGGDRMPMNYLLKFEEYLDDHDIYLFDGWEDAKIIYAPKIDKFWTTFYLYCPKHTDLKGALRLLTSEEEQNEIKAKKLDDGGHLLIFKILKKYLDQIEERNKQHADELSDEEMEYL